MARRVEQGLGRIGRREGEWGVGIILFDITRVLGGKVKSVVAADKLIKMKAWDCSLLLHKIFVDRSVTVGSFPEKVTHSAFKQFSVFF